MAYVRTSEIVACNQTPCIYDITDICRVECTVLAGSSSCLTAVEYLCARFTVSHWYSQHIRSTINCIRNTARIAWPKYAENAEKYEDSESKIRCARRYHFKKPFTQVCFFQCVFAVGSGSYYLLLFETELTGKTDYRFGILVFFCIFCIFWSLNRW